LHKFKFKFNLFSSSYSSKPDRVEELELGDELPRSDNEYDIDDNDGDIDGDDSELSENEVQGKNKV